MKKVFLAALVFLAPAAAFSQQILWSTVPEYYEGDVRRVEKDAVRDEIMHYCDWYDYFYDFSGSTRENAVEELGDTWSWLLSVDYDFITAVRSIQDMFSFIIVVSVREGAVDLVMFSDSREDGALDISRRAEIGLIVNSLF